MKKELWAPIAIILASLSLILTAWFSMQPEDSIDPAEVAQMQSQMVEMREELARMHVLIEERAAAHALEAAEPAVAPDPAAVPNTIAPEGPDGVIDPGATRDPEP